MKPLLALLILSFGPWSPIRADDVAPPNVRVEMKVVSLPQTLALPILSSRPSEASAEEIMARLDDTIRKGHGVLEAWLHAHPRGGEMLKSGSGEEQRYMIEFEQPQFPGGWGASRLLNRLAEGVIPTTFETRHLGFELEVDSVIARSGDFIDVRCTSKHTVLIGWSRAAAGIAPSGIAISHPQPRFSTRSLTTHATVTNKRWVLVGTFLRKGEPPRAELRFLRATIINAPRTP